VLKMVRNASLLYIGGHKGEREKFENEVFNLSRKTRFQIGGHKGEKEKFENEVFNLSRKTRFQFSHIIVLCLGNKVENVREDIDLII